jgi:hypothetical protein
MNTEVRAITVITMHPVKSSQIAEIGHDVETETLAIRFTSRSGPGSVYHYANFTTENFAAFKSAESIGSYFGKHIKNAVDQFPFVKVS